MAAIEIIAPRVQDKEAVEKYLKNHGFAYTLHYFGSPLPYRIYTFVPNYWELRDGLLTQLQTYKHVKETGHQVKINEIK